MALSGLYESKSYSPIVQLACMVVRSRSKSYQINHDIRMVYPDKQSLPEVYGDASLSCGIHIAYIYMKSLILTTTIANPLFYSYVNVEVCFSFSDGGSV